MADRKSSPQQIAQSVFNPETDSIQVNDISNLVPSTYNEIRFAYNGQNVEPVTATYLLNGVNVAILNFEYDINGRITRVYRQS